MNIVTQRSAPPIYYQRLELPWNVAIFDKSVSRTCVHSDVAGSSFHSPT